MANIKYVSKNKLYPKFGEAVKNSVFIRNDLPSPVKKFVKEHELYHLEDNAKNWIWREIKANTSATIKHPLGFIITLVMSLQPYRLKFYIKKLKE